MPDIDRIKTNQGREESPVCLGDLIARQVAFGGQDGLDPIQRSEEFCKSFLISILAGCEATSIHTVVDGVVDPVVDRIDFREQIFRHKSSLEPVIPSKAEFSIRMISLDSLLTMVPVSRSHKMGTVTRPE